MSLLRQCNTIHLEHLSLQLKRPLAFPKVVDMLVKCLGLSKRELQSAAQHVLLQLVVTSADAEVVCSALVTTACDHQVDIGWFLPHLNLLGTLLCHHGRAKHTNTDVDPDHTSNTDLDSSMHISSSAISHSIVTHALAARIKTGINHPDTSVRGSCYFLMLNQPERLAKGHFGNGEAIIDSVSFGLRTNTENESCIINGIVCVEILLCAKEYHSSLITSALLQGISKSHSNLPNFAYDL